MTNPHPRTERVLFMLREPQGIHIDSLYEGRTTIAFILDSSVKAAREEIELLVKERDEARLEYCRLLHETEAGSKPSQTLAKVAKKSGWEYLLRKTP